MTLRTRLAKIEQRRRSDRSNLDDPNRPRHLSEILGGPYDPSITLATIFRALDERMAREMANGTWQPPAPPDPDYIGENIIDLESCLLKIRGDRGGWRARQRFLKRDVDEMVRRDWPDIDSDLAKQ